MRVHIWRPLPGTTLVGIDVPRTQAAMVHLGDVLRPTWGGPSYPPLTQPIGLDVVGRPVLADLAQMPHLLVAGSTGSGRSMFLHAMIAGLVMRNSPRLVRLLLIDRQGTELRAWEGAPHVLPPAMVDVDLITNTLCWLSSDVIDSRAERLAKAGVRDVWAYNAAQPVPQAWMPIWVLVVDELGDLLAVAPRATEELLVRFAALGRAVGLHLILAMQRPSGNVVAGVLKANIPARLACRLPSASESRTVLDQAGAEDLLGQGDALYLAADGALTRVQGALLRPQDVRAVSAAWAPPTRC